MNSILCLIILWYIWMIQTFFAVKNKYRTTSAAFILVLIILFPMEWQAASIVVHPAFLLLYAGGLLIFPLLPSDRKRRVFYFSAAFAFLFAAVRLAEWYEPVVFLFGHSVTYLSIFSVLFFVFGKSLHERVSMAVTACSSGEILSRIHLRTLTDNVILGDPLLLKIILFLILLLHIYDTAAKGMKMLKRSENRTLSSLPR
ncbi:YphA family membrane protein [Salibacterium qingdaonense]|uniref:Uncharacterized protein n=1 Tax=Salibacterium qingdaonense TaxID=266892 RepID=A0A1I4M4W3_9BACI|nr:hypothetical protein SAMN04488054_11041 [Salibacterium qingdaonense]